MLGLGRTRAKQKPPVAEKAATGRAALPGWRPDAASDAGRGAPTDAAVASDGGSTVVRMQLVGGKRQPQVVEEEELPGKSNYFLGNDPARWRTNVPNYAKVRCSCGGRTARW